jgi:hypothetical protein
MSEFKENRFYISLDGGEMFVDGPYDTREIAVKKVLGDPKTYDLEPRQTFFTGKLIPPNLDELIDFNTDLLMEEFQEKAAEEYGEFSDSWLTDVTREQENDLQEKLKGVFISWMLEHNHTPNFGSIDEAEEHTIPGGVDEKLN